MMMDVFACHRPFPEWMIESCATHTSLPLLFSLCHSATLLLSQLPLSFFLFFHRRARNLSPESIDRIHLTTIWSRRIRRRFGLTNEWITRISTIRKEVTRIQSVVLVFQVSMDIFIYDFLWYLWCASLLANLVGLFFDAIYHYNETTNQTYDQT